MMADKKSTTKYKTLKIILAAAAGTALLLCFGSLARKEHIYRTAQACIEQNDYGKACEVLESIEEEDYKDAQTLLWLCRAHYFYEKGDIETAWWWGEYMPGGFRSEAQKEAYLAFRSQIKKEYDAYIKEKEEQERLEYEWSLLTGVPFVGMREEDIGRTSLGSPSSKVRHNNEAINGKIYRANLYDFYVGNARIFSARCVQGVVTEVWDTRDDPVVRRSYDTKSTAKDDRKDPYQAGDYSHAEDFYYDHYDDFFDYSEAEDYWNEHQE